jgi:DNA-directed RNA polymerase subunit RPC12/RpoP
MYECFHCGKRAVVWDSDFSFDEMCYEGDGIVHICHCSECGAEIEYRVAIEDDTDADSEG